MDISVFREEKMSQKYNDDFIEYLPQIRNSASILAGKFGGTFVIDELVNEAWIRGRNSDRPNKSQFVQRATWDMKDYVRSMFGRENYSYKGKKIETKKRPQFITNYEDLERPEDAWAHFSGRSIFDVPVDNKDLLNLENKELIELILKAPSKKQLESIRLYYFENMYLKEAGELLGIAECTVHNNITKGIKNCRSRVELIDKVHELQKKLGIADKKFAY